MSCSKLCFFFSPPGNSWQCSPELSWMYEWSKPLMTESRLRNIGQTRCFYEDIRFDAPLFLVMEYYVEHVLPSCPKKDRCHCQIFSIQETLVQSKERAYSVHVFCVNQGLNHFPKMPRHTTAVDLTGNKVKIPV